ncbi:hypothetical protein JCM11641_008245 [Rhodosporidiobolus odoratus]
MKRPSYLVVSFKSWSRSWRTCPPEVSTPAVLMKGRAGEVREWSNGRAAMQRGKKVESARSGRIAGIGTFLLPKLPFLQAQFCSLPLSGLLHSYDLLHLLPTLPSTYPSRPTISAITQGDPDLERGFDFLPSEHEELFFFTPQERVELERKKKRRKVEEGREERVRMLEERERAEQAEQNEADKPSAEQLALMQRLHRTLQTSPNPSLLELRILANHGSDPRFRFLRCKGQGQGEEKNGGKLSEVWERIRRGEDPLGREKEVEKETAMGGGGLGGLLAYGSSDEEEDEAGGAEGEEEVEVAGKEKGNEGDVQDDSIGAAAGTAEDIGDEKQVAKPSPVEATRRSASVPGATGEPGTELDEAQRRKQLEKQERAKEWARKRKEKREAEESAEQ